MMDKTVTTIIDEELCTGCGLCIEVCPSNTITIEGNKAVVTGRKSLNCGHCSAVCPTGAIKVSAMDPDLVSFKNFQPKESWLPFGEGSTADLLNIMQSRRSCRNFTEKPVQKDLLEDLVKIGASAPSGSNCQDWTFTILPDRDSVEHLAGLAGRFYANLNRTAEKAWLRKTLKWLGKPELEEYYQNYYESIRKGLEKWKKEGKDLLFHSAQAAIIVGSKDEATCPADDALLATQNILLGAHTLGLGTCLIGFVIKAMEREKSIARKIDIPDDETAYSVIALGYPKEKYQRLTGRKKALIRYCKNSRGS